MLLAARMLLLASSASALVVGGAAASRSSLSALDAPLVTMQARDDWKFGTGAPLGYKRGVGGTGREEKALPNEKGAFLSSEDEFRHGTGSVAPKPLGGVMAFNRSTNPDFHAWTMVFVHYCDGSSFSSYRCEAFH